jgi:hypothetical protein
MKVLRRQKLFDDDDSNMVKTISYPIKGQVRGTEGMILIGK